MNSKIVGVHQPNFLPWLGYFYKIYKSTDFVFLDNVQIETGSQQAYVNRTKVNSNTGELWLTCPISKENSESKLISDTCFVSKFNWRKKILKTLFFNYQKSAHFKSIYPFIEDLIDKQENKLAIYNIEMIKSISNKLELETTFHIASHMNLKSDEKNQRLVEICQQLDSVNYLAGKGGLLYQDKEHFIGNGIDIIPVNFTHPKYMHQLNFIPGLSITDALFSVGFDGVRNLITDEV